MVQIIANRFSLRSKTVNIWLAMVLGALLLSLLSIFQKHLLGAPLFALQGFLIPVVFGGGVGLTIGLLFYRNQAVFDERLAEQAKSHQELAESEERFRLLADNARDVIFRWMLHEHRYQYVSPAVYTLTGHPPQAFLDNPQLLRSLIFPEDQQLFHDFAQQVMSGEVLPHIEYRVVHKKGHIVWINQRHAFGFDDQGTAISLEGICTDITRYRAVRQEKLEVENQLYQSQKMEAIGRLAGGIAHDFNNLLTVINGYSELLLENEQHNDQESFELLEIQKAGSKAADLTAQLLTFSRKQIATPRLLDPRLRVQESLRMLRRMIGEDIRIEQNLAEGVPNIFIDSIQLDQVLMNLVVNAQEAMPDGGTISIRVHSKELDRRHCQTCHGIMQGAMVVLEVSDTGSGMTPEVSQRIFEPFFTTKDIHQGTGLGLSTVYGIVQQNEGHIEVDSTFGTGTRFTVSLPAFEPSIETEITPPVLESPQLRGSESILVVEDESLVRSLAATVLKQYGYQVLIAAEGQEALEIFRGHGSSIDLVLTDVVMPGISGVELVRDLLELKADLKVVFMSGYVDKKLDVSGITESPHCFLKKPFGSEALARIVRQVLDGVPH